MGYTAKSIFRIHLSIIALLAAGYGMTVVLGQLGRGRLFGLSKLLNPGLELSIPNYFSSLALLVVGLSAWAIRTKLPSNAPERRGWAIFAFTFLFLAIDEQVQIHETLSALTPAYLQGTELYIPLLIPFGLIMFRFWLRQPMPVRVGIMVAGILYVLAAVLVEINEWRLVTEERLAYTSLQVQLNQGLEEFGEMIAVSLFLRTFLIRYAMLGGGALVPLKIRGVEGEPVDELVETRVYA